MNIFEYLTTGVALFAGLCGFFCLAAWLSQGLDKRGRHRMILRHVRRGSVTKKNWPL